MESNISLHARVKPVLGDSLIKGIFSDLLQRTPSINNIFPESVDFFTQLYNDDETNRSFE